MDHLVSTGESLESIAKRYGTTASALQQINRLAAPKVTVGQRLTVALEPDGADADGFYFVRKYESWGAIALKFKTDEATLRSLNPEAAQLEENQRIRVKFTKLERLSFSRPKASAWAQYHLAQPGESLSLIAARFAIAESELRAFNALTEDFTVYPQCRLRVSQIMYRPDETAIAPDFYPAVFEGIAPSELRFHTLAKSETLEQVSQMYGLDKERLLALNFLKPDVSAHQGMKLWIEGQLPGDLVEDAPIFHTCQKSQTAHHVAVLYGLSRAELLRINSLPANFEPYQGFVFRLRPAAQSGQRLCTFYNPKESLASLAKRFGIDYERILKLNGLSAQSSPQSGQPIFLTAKARPTQADVRLHIVSQGESLALLATQIRVLPKEIIRLNGLQTDSLNPGQWLFVPVMPPPPLPAHLQMDGVEVLESRNGLGLQTKEGQRFMGSSLKGEVGRTQAIDPDDLSRVQAQLEDLGLLAPDHAESPQKILKTIGRQAITSRQIPLTIQSIERFQAGLRQTRLPKGLRPAEPGLVRPGDATDFALRNFAVHILPSFVLTNFAAHDHQAIDYPGQTSLSALRGQEFSEPLWDILEFAMPGRLDSVSTRPLRYGLLGFGGDELAGLLAQMKFYSPIEFRAYFQRFGIDVEFSESKGKLSSPVAKYLDTSCITGEFELRGQSAIEAFDTEALVCLIGAASVPVLAAQQVLLAMQTVVWPALSLRINLEINQKSFSHLGVCEIMSSHLGACALVDFAAHAGLAATAAAFRSAFQSLAAQYKLRQPIQLRTLETKEILNVLRNSAPDAIIRQRATALLAAPQFSPHRDAFFAFPENLLRYP